MSQSSFSVELLGSRYKLLSLVLVVGLLVSQIGGLQHTHDGDLSPSYECAFCVQMASGGDAIDADSISFDVQSKQQVAAFLLKPDVLSTNARPNARAPPVLS